MGDQSSAAVDDMPAAQLAAVIPAFNEARTITALVHQVRERAIAIVVDDGSTDNTAALAEAAGAYVVRHPLNRGYDCAVETGLRTALALRCGFAVTMDADGQHDPTLLDRFHAELKAGANLVVGQRDRTQRWSETLFCFIGRLAWGLNDPLCGMKGYSMLSLARVEHINTYASIGTELAVRLVKAGVAAQQLPVKTRPREGISRFGQGFMPNLKISKALWMGIFCPPAFRQSDK